MVHILGERKPACVIVALLRASKMAGHINSSWKLVFIRNWIKLFLYACSSLSSEVVKLMAQNISNCCFLRVRAALMLPAVDLLTDVKWSIVQHLLQAWWCLSDSEISSETTWLSLQVCIKNYLLGTQIRMLKI